VTPSEQACQVLYGTSTIDFSVGGLHINFAGLQRVRDAIEHDRIHVAIDARPDRAEYDKRANTISLPSADFQNPLVKGITVHEAVHGLCDLARAAHTTPLSEECAAYLAQTIYIRNASGATLTGSRPEDVPIFGIATELCYAKRLFTERGQRLVWADYAALREVISRHPLYAGYSTQSANDGVPE
jgi:hypothetical protein